MDKLLDVTQPVCRALLDNFSLIEWLELALTCKATWKFVQLPLCYKTYSPVANSPYDALRMLTRTKATNRCVRFLSPITLVIEAIIYTNNMHKISWWQPSSAIHLLNSITSSEARRLYLSATGVSCENTLFYAINRYYATRVFVKPSLTVSNEDRTISLITLLTRAEYINVPLLLALLDTRAITYEPILATAILIGVKRLEDLLKISRCHNLSVTKTDITRFIKAWAFLRYRDRRLVADVCKKYMPTEGYIKLIFPYQSVRYFEDQCEDETYINLIVKHLPSDCQSSIIVSFLKILATRPHLDYIDVVRRYLVSYEEEVMKLVDVLGKMCIIHLPPTGESEHYTAYARYYNSRGWHPHLLRVSLLAPCILIRSRPPLADYIVVKDPLTAAYKAWINGELREAYHHCHAAITGLITQRTPYTR